MKTFELQFSEQAASKIQEAADRLSLSAEEFLLVSVEEKLARLGVNFQTASDYVLKKNAELYQRLA